MKRYKMLQLLKFTCLLCAFSLLHLSAQSQQLQDSYPLAPPAISQTEPEVVKAGKDVTPPVLIHSKAPKYSRVARRARLSGLVLVGCYVETDGKPSNIHIVRTTIQATAAGLSFSRRISDGCRWTFPPVTLRRKKPTQTSGLAEWTTSASNGPRDAISSFRRSRR